MTISKCGKFFIAVGSLVALAIVLAIGYGVMYFTEGFRQHCHPEVKKCNETNHLYHLETQQCLRAGIPEESICGNNMVISPVPACLIQGQCECDYENNERHLVYDNATDQCYPIYSQGPCDDGFVITISSKRKERACKPDICVEEKSKVPVTERDLIVPYENKCYALHIELDEPGCKGQLKFWKNQLHPSCSPAATLKTGQISLFTSSDCKPGSVKVLNGQCRPSIAFTIERPSDDSDEE